MECSLEQRKRELLAECKLPSEALLAAASRVEDFMQPFRRSFCRRRQATYATTVVQGLCSDLQAKNGESIAYLFGLDRKTIQHFIGESSWDDQPLRGELARQVGAQLGEADGVLAFDPSAFAKSGDQSVGVASQWCGRLGKVENCQVGVYVAYVSSQGHALVDVDLYLPLKWTKDKTRMQRAGVPQGQQRYRTRHEICLDLLDRVGAHLPHAWITGDDELGRPAAFRRELRQRHERYLLAVPGNTTIRDLELPAPPATSTTRPPQRASQSAKRWAAALADDAWTKIEVRDGEKGPLAVEVVARRVETGQRHRPTVAEEVLVVIRYRDREQAIVKLDYYLSNAAADTPLAEYCRAAKAEHRIEECLQRAKGQAGLADYEVRNWVGWQHHQTLSLLANWFLTVETRQAEKKDPRHHVPTIAHGDRLPAPRRITMRYALGSAAARRATPASQPTRPPVPLVATP